MTRSCPVLRANLSGGLEVSAVANPSTAQRRRDTAKGPNREVQPLAPDIGHGVVRGPVAWIVKRLLDMLVG